MEGSSDLEAVFCYLGKRFVPGNENELNKNQKELSPMLGRSVLLKKFWVK